MPILTRQEAAAEMVDGAIGAWLAGKHACAITLAGAAETGMPKIDDQTTGSDFAIALVMNFKNCERKKAVRIVNTGRDWLKHYTLDRPEQISADLTWAYVMRAYLHFRAVYPDAPQTENMQALRGKIEEQLQPVRAAAKKLTDGLRSLGRIANSMQPAAGHIVTQRVDPDETDAEASVTIASNREN